MRSAIERPSRQAHNSFRRRALCLLITLFVSRLARQLAGAESLLVLVFAFVFSFLLLESPVNSASSACGVARRVSDASRSRPNERRRLSPLAWSSPAERKWLAARTYSDILLGRLFNFLGLVCVWTDFGHSLSSLIARATFRRPAGRLVSLLSEGRVPMRSVQLVRPGRDNISSVLLPALALALATHLAAPAGIL